MFSELYPLHGTEDDAKDTGQSRLAHIIGLAEGTPFRSVICLSRHLRLNYMVILRRSRVY